MSILIFHLKVLLFLLSFKRQSVKQFWTFDSSSGQPSFTRTLSKTQKKSMTEEECCTKIDFQTFHFEFIKPQLAKPTNIAVQT